MKEGLEYEGHKYWGFFLVFFNTLLGMSIHFYYDSWIGENTMKTCCGTVFSGC